MKTLLDFIQSASNAVADNVAGPVDLLSLGLNKLGVPVGDKPIGGTNWQREMGLRRDVQQGPARVLGETAGLLGPAMATQFAPQIARGLLSLDDKAMDMGRQAIEKQMVRSGGIQPAITLDTEPILRGMTKTQFLGKPKIVGKSDSAGLLPLQIKSLEGVDTVPFMDGKYQAKYSPSGAAVFDGEKTIASYNFGDTLTVAKPYRKKGIGKELVYQQRTYYPEAAQASTRNKVSQGIQEDVWDRIQSELTKTKRGLLD